MYCDCTPSIKSCSRIRMRNLYERLLGSKAPHAADHLLMECLAELLWEAERAGQPPDESAFLARARRVTG